MSERRSRVLRRIGAATRADAPLLVPGLKAWFDARTDAWLTFSSGSAISAWASRAGSLGSVTRTQGTAANQPTRATAVSTLGGKNAVLFDGSNDYFDTDNQNAWKFLHDGTGASRFWVIRMDSTGGATQAFSHTCNGSTVQVGISLQYAAASASLRVTNGSGAVLNEWTLGTAAHYAKDVSRWQMWGYVDGTQHSRVSGSSLTNSDAGAQDPSASNPTLALRTGANAGAGSPLKGYLATDIFYDHILTTAELAQLTAWANKQFGVTV